jgi:hypothetical protein
MEEYFDKECHMSVAPAQLGSVVGTLTRGRITDYMCLSSVSVCLPSGWRHTNKAFSYFILFCLTSIFFFNYSNYFIFMSFIYAKLNIIYQ